MPEIRNAPGIGHMSLIPLLILHRDATILNFSKLLADSGFTVDLAVDAADREQDICNDKYKFILTDPYDHLLGAENLIPAWRSEGVTSHVIAISGDQSVKTKVRTLDMGADDYMVLPVEYRELLSRLRAALRRANGTHSVRIGSVIRTHDLVIDMITLRVTRRDQSIALTPREFSLLRLLASEKGRAVSRSEIRNGLYEKNCPLSSNVIDVLIRRLRVKIDSGFDTPLILTQFGVGYLLRDDHC